MDFKTAVVLCISSIFCTLGFALLFKVSKKTFPFIVLSGFLTCIAYVVCCKFFVNEFYQNVFPSIIGTSLSELFARITKSTATPYVACSQVILIPGSKLYYTIYYFIVSDMAQCRSSLVSLLRIASGLAVGILLVTVVIREINQKKFKDVNNTSD